jgi:micrococcal nuclease
MMVPGVRGGSAGALALLAILLYLLIAGGSDDDGNQGGTAGGKGAAPQGSITARVVDVVDGDTIEVSIDGRVDDVRYIGVDTPETVKPGEPVECFGPEASEFNHELVEGRVVKLEFDRELRDVYDRLLAYVFVGDTFVNEELIRGGFARTLEIEPNTSRAGQLAEVEQRAGDDGRGLWSTC